MMYDRSYFDQPISRMGTASEKWDGIQETEQCDLLPMWVADMDFRCAEEITDAIRKRAEHPVYGYTFATEKATRAMLDFMQRRHGLTLTADEQSMMPCVITGLRAGVLALTQPGDGVIVQPPVYGPFFASVKDNGRNLMECPLIHHEDGSYEMDFDSVEEACKKGAKLMLLCNPHNPVGHAWEKEVLEKLWSILKKYGVWLVSDEIHEDFQLEPGCFTPMLNIATGKDDKVCSLTSASKTFNLAGLQQAVMFTRNEDMKARMEAAMHNAGVVQGNIFAMEATEAAFGKGDAWLDGLLDYLRGNAEYLRRELNARLPEIVLSPSNATYVGWMDMRAYGLTDEELTRRTHEAGVAFTGGPFFGAETGKGFLRFNFACPRAQVEEAIKRLEKAFKA